MMGHRFREKMFWQTAGNRLRKPGDTAKVGLVAPARPAGFGDGGLRHLHGPPAGPGAEYVSDMVCSQGARGGGIQSEISHELSQKVRGGRPSPGAIVLSRG